MKIIETASYYKKNKTAGIYDVVGRDAVEQQYKAQVARNQHANQNLGVANPNLVRPKIDQYIDEYVSGKRSWEKLIGVIKELQRDKPNIAQKITDYFNKHPKIVGKQK